MTHFLYCLRLLGGDNFILDSCAIFSCNLFCFLFKKKNVLNTMATFTWCLAHSICLSSKVAYWRISVSAPRISRCRSWNKKKQRNNQWCRELSRAECKSSPPVHNWRWGPRTCPRGFSLQRSVRLRELRDSLCCLAAQSEEISRIEQSLDINSSLWREGMAGVGGVTWLMIKHRSQHPQQDLRGEKHC